MPDFEIPAPAENWTRSYSHFLGEHLFAQLYQMTLGSQTLLQQLDKNIQKLDLLSELQSYFEPKQKHETKVSPDKDK